MSKSSEALEPDIKDWLDDIASEFNVQRLLNIGAEAFDIGQDPRQVYDEWGEVALRGWWARKAQVDQGEPTRSGDSGVGDAGASPGLADGPSTIIEQAGPASGTPAGSNHVFVADTSGWVTESSSAGGLGTAIATPEQPTNAPVSSKPEADVTELPAVTSILPVVDLADTVEMHAVEPYDAPLTEAIETQPTPPPEAGKVVKLTEQQMKKLRDIQNGVGLTERFKRLRGSRLGGLVIKWAGGSKPVARVEELSPSAEPAVTASSNVPLIEGVASDETIDQANTGGGWRLIRQVPPDGPLFRDRTTLRQWIKEIDESNGVSSDEPTVMVGDLGVGADGQGVDTGALQDLVKQPRSTEDSK